jgi:hypothetical protein
MADEGAKVLNKERVTNAHLENILSKGLAELKAVVVEVERSLERLGRRVKGHK